MKTKTINLYNFEELKPEIQEKVISEFRANNDYTFLEEDLKEYLMELLEENKISFDDSLKLYYSLSNCQGDGVCFIGNLETQKARFKIIHQSRYYHERSTIIDLTELKVKGVFRDLLDLNGSKDKEIDKELLSFKKLYINICHLVENKGYSHINYLDSKECIIENINANQYTFRENGAIENE